MTATKSTPTPEEDDDSATRPAWDASDGVPEELRTYTVEQLAVILKRSVKSIKVDVTRKPDSLPPVFRMPRSRKILFRHVDVRAWMDELSFTAARRREAEAEALRRTWRPIRGPRR